MIARAVFAAVLVSLLPASAAAAPRQVAKVGEFTLDASRSHGQLCIDLRRKRHLQGGTCGRVPRSAQRALRIDPDVGWNNYASAVPAAVRVAEVETPSGKRIRHRTLGSRAFPALRFVIIPAPRGGVMFVRFYDAGGTLIGIDFGQAGYIGSDENVTQLLGDHDAGVSANTEPRLSPTPDQADRLRALACITLVNQHGGSGTCASQSEGVVSLISACEAASMVGGIVPAGAATVRLILGTGAALDVPTAGLPPAFGGKRGFSATIPVGLAVRDVTALDASGQGLSRAALGVAPAGQPCGENDQGDDHFDGPLIPLAPPAGAATVASGVLVADQGAEALCVGVGALVAENCPPAPADSDEPVLVRAGDTVGGALSRDAARVTLRIDGGAHVTVATTDGAAYTGRWAGRLRFFAASVPAGRKVVGATIRNAAGTIIGESAKGVVEKRVNRRALLDRVQLIHETGRAAVRDRGRRRRHARAPVLHRPAPGRADRRPVPSLQRCDRRLVLAPGRRRLWALPGRPAGSVGRARRRPHGPRAAHRAPVPRRLDRTAPGCNRPRPARRQAQRHAAASAGQPAVRLQRLPPLLTRFSTGGDDGVVRRLALLGLLVLAGCGGNAVAARQPGAGAPQLRR